MAITAQQLLAEICITVYELVASEDLDASHVCQCRELVEVPALGFHFGEDLIQSVHPDDLLAQRAGDDVIGDSHSGLLGLMLDQIFDARCHSCGDDRCFLSLH